MEQFKLIAATIGLSAVVIAVLALSVIAIPIILGIGITLSIYAILRILTEDAD